MDGVFVFIIEPEFLEYLAHSRLGESGEIGDTLFLTLQDDGVDDVGGDVGGLFPLYLGEALLHMVGPFVVEIGDVLWGFLIGWALCIKYGLHHFTAGVAGEYGLLYV